MGAKFLGAHMPTGKGLDDALRRGKGIGCTAVQVFTSSPQMWKSKELTDEVIARFAAAKAETGIDRIVSHDSYLVNLCSPDAEIQAKSRAALASELSRCSRLGIPYVVSHMGAHMGQGEEEGLKIVAREAAAIIADAPANVMLLMETTAGQGSALNHTFEQLAAILDLAKRPSNLAVCLDTCHVFSAGYDLREPEPFRATFDDFDRLIGIANLRAIHVNDSKFGLGSRKDRHEHLGQGALGEKAFRLLVTEPRLENIPMLLETPDAETQHVVNLSKLWDWARGPIPV